MRDNKNRDNIRRKPLFGQSVLERPKTFFSTYSENQKRCPYSLSGGKDMHA